MIGLVLRTGDRRGAAIEIPGGLSPGPDLHRLIAELRVELRSIEQLIAEIRQDRGRLFIAPDPAPIANRTRSRIRRKNRLTECPRQGSAT